MPSFAIKTRNGGGVLEGSMLSLTGHIYRGAQDTW